MFLWEEEKTGIRKEWGTEGGSGFLRSRRKNVRTRKRTTGAGLMTLQVVNGEPKLWYSI